MSYRWLTYDTLGLAHLFDSYSEYRALCGVDGVRWCNDVKGKQKCGICIEERDERRKRRESRTL